MSEHGQGIRNGAGYVWELGYLLLYLAWELSAILGMATSIMAFIFRVRGIRRRRRQRLQRNRKLQQDGLNGQT